ncbi:MAG: amino acid ABC transporter permease [Clostridia bacterium]
MNFSYFFSLFGSLSQGFLTTLNLFLIALALSIPLGLVIAFMRTSRVGILRGISGVYVWLLRGTPLLLQLYFFFFGLPNIPGIGQYLILGRFEAACWAFVLNYAAYFAEIFRGGMLSIDAGQYEAAQVLGFNRLQTIRFLTVPQMLRVCLPAISNEAITLVKDTALVTAIGVTDILYYAKHAVNRDVDTSAFIVAAIFYLAMSYFVTKLFDLLEKRFRF